jgi:hypothetical protein
VKEPYRSSAITNPEDHLLSIDFISASKHPSPYTSHNRSIRSKEWLVFNRLSLLVEEFPKASPERQGILLKILNEDTLNKWKMAIATFPHSRVTHHLPFITVLVTAHDTFLRYAVL